MNWIASKLVTFAIVTVLTFVLTLFLYLRVQDPKQWKIAGSLFIVFLVLSLAGWWHLRIAPPGLEETQKEKERDPNQQPVSSLVARLRQTWNSEGDSNWHAAESLAELCHLAYRPPVDAREAFQKLGFTYIETVVHASMIGYVIVLEDVAVVVFRGTDDNYDWFSNLRSSTVPTVNGPIHSGFNDAYLPLKEQIKKILSLQKVNHIWLTGHSLGGALSVICAHDLIENGQLPVHGVMTFGQPMLASRELASHLDTLLFGKYAHFVNETDIVPRVPPALKHFGSLVWFTQGRIERSKRKVVVFGAGEKDTFMKDSQDDVLEPLSEQEFEKAKAKLRRTSTTSTPPDEPKVYASSFVFIEDHSMELYLDKVRKNVGVKGALPPATQKEGK